MNNCECENLVKALKNISKILDTVKYDLCSREYTLDEDSMGWVVYCRDFAWKTANDYEKNHTNPSQEP